MRSPPDAPSGEVAPSSPKRCRYSTRRASARQRARYYAGLARRSPQGLVRQLLKRGGVDRWVQPVLWEVDLRRRGQIRPGHRLWYSWYRLWRLAGPDWDPSPYGGDLTLYWAGGTGATDSTINN